MSRKAFTLIELLVVISVIALLATTVFNSLRGARESARISNALSFQHQIHSLLGADLVGWWNFDDSANRYGDLSGGGNTGICTACPTLIDGVPGTRGMAVNFDGSGERLTINNPLSQIGQTQVTISVWYRRDDISAANNWRTIIGHGTGNIHHLLIHQSSRNLGLWDGAWRDFNYNPGNDVWNHYIVIYNNGVSARLYVNGVFHNEIATSLNLFSNPIGSIGNWAGGNYWSGIIDDVRIYSRALTASEIQTLYAQTRDKYLVEEK